MHIELCCWVFLRLWLLSHFESLNCDCIVQAKNHQSNCVQVVQGSWEVCKGHSRFLQGCLSWVLHFDVGCQPCDNFEHSCFLKANPCYQIPNRPYWEMPLDSVCSHERRAFRLRYWVIKNWTQKVLGGQNIHCQKQLWCNKVRFIISKSRRICIYISRDWWNSVAWSFLQPPALNPNSYSHSYGCIHILQYTMYHVTWPQTRDSFRGSISRLENQFFAQLQKAVWYISTESEQGEHMHTMLAHCMQWPLQCTCHVYDSSLK